MTHACILCNSPAPSSQEDSLVTHNCQKCGSYYRADTFDITKVITPHIMKLTDNNPSNYKESLKYRSFLTYLRRNMWVEGIKRHQMEPHGHFSSSPAPLNEAILADALENSHYLNLVHCAENAVIAFGLNEQGFFNGYHDSDDKRQRNDTMAAVFNKDLLFYRIIGLDLHDVLKKAQSSTPLPMDPWNFYAVNRSEFKNIIQQMMDNGLLFLGAHSQRGPTINDYKLTFKGWEQFNAWSEDKFLTNIAFMAMGFNDKNFIAYRQIFKPAVEACGFQLQTVDEVPGHGSIPDDMELKIRRAPFVIVDISGGNNGAYWEAGYATALGKPVIYTCDQDTWKSLHAEKRPHFDVVHRQRIMWVEATEDAIAALSQNQDASLRLKAIIRNKIPGARLND